MAKRTKQTATASDWEDPKKEFKQKERDKKTRRSADRQVKLSEKHKFIT